MKKTVIALLLCALLCALCACGSEAPAQAPATGSTTATASPAETAEAAETTAPEAQQPEDAGETGETDGPDYGPLYFVYGDCTFGILDEAGWVLNALGEPFDTMVADSCAYQGSDCYYFYDGIELCVNDVDGTERITGITLADDTVKNPQGLHIGMAVDDALAAMDMEYANADGVYSFTYGPAQLRLRADSEGTVAAISYVPAE